MNTLPLAVRVFAASAAVSVTLALLAGVLAIAEPQRSVLIAKTQPAPAAAVAVAMAPAGPGRGR